MAICSRCGSPVADDMRYCGVCANPMAQVPAPIDPPAGPRVPGGLKAQAGVGMGLSIYGFYMALAGMSIVSMYSFIGLFGFLASFSDPTALIMTFMMGMYGLLFAAVFCSYSLPMGIVGMVLGKGSRKRGNPSKMCSVAGGLGLSALIISVVMTVIAVAVFVLGIFGIMMLDSYSAAYY